MKITAQVRAEIGSGASRRLRASGMMPGIVYGASTDPVNIILGHNEIFYALKKEEFHSSIHTLVVDGKEQQVLLRDFQVHAYKPQILHIDFQRIDPNKEISIKVPLHFLNEASSPAAKTGVVHHAFTELEISCLPADLPTHIDIDLGQLEIGQSIHLSDITLPKGVTAVARDTSLTIVSASEITATEEPEQTTEESAETSATPAAEAAPAEGEKKE